MNIEQARATMIKMISQNRRSVEFTSNAPINWTPSSVKDLRPNRPSQFFENFTRTSCWDFIEEKLVEGQEIEILTLRKPPGAKAYVMKIDQGNAIPRIYIKLQIGKNSVLGRSFHYEDNRN